MDSLSNKVSVLRRQTMTFCVVAGCLSLISLLSVVEFEIDKALQVGRYEYDTWVMISIIVRVTASRERDAVCCRCYAEVDEAGFQPKVHYPTMVIPVPLEPLLAA